MKSVINIVKKRVEVRCFPVKLMPSSYLLESASFIRGPDLNPLWREMTTRTGQGSQLPLQGRLQRSPGVFLIQFQLIAPPGPCLPQVYIHVPPQTEGTVLPHVIGSPWGSKDAVFSHSPLHEAVGSLCKTTSWTVLTCMRHYIRETPDKWLWQPFLMHLCSCASLGKKP